MLVQHFNEIFNNSDFIIGFPSIIRDPSKCKLSFRLDSFEIYWRNVKCDGRYIYDCQNKKL